MGISVLVIVAVVTVLLAVGWLGYKKKQKTDAIAERVTREMINQNPGVELLGQVAYHGGFPQMAKPSLLQLGVAADGLLLFDYSGWSARLAVADWCGLDQFSISVKADTAGRSTATLGPLVPFFFKDTVRHFIVVQYIDVNSEQNHLLLERDSESARQLVFDRLSHCGMRHESANRPTGRILSLIK